MEKISFGQCKWIRLFFAVCADHVCLEFWPFLAVLVRNLSCGWPYWHHPACQTKKIEGGKLSHKQCPIKMQSLLGHCDSRRCCRSTTAVKIPPATLFRGMWESNDFSRWAPSVKWMKSKCVHIFCFQGSSQFSCFVSFSFSFSASFSLLISASLLLHIFYKL